ncbi:MAG: matrixin family metalloprotease [Dehalococcoidia bacterium]
MTLAAVAAWLVWGPGAGGGERGGEGCTEVIVWHVGQVDPRFGISEEDLWNAVDGAARMWEAGAGRTLFLHRPGQGMVVELTYDARQRQLQARLDEEERLRAQADRLQEGRAYARDVERFEAAVEAYSETPLRAFQAGEYSHSRHTLTGRISQRRIRIFAVADAAHLQTTLAHEMGHALELNHVATSGAVMSAEEQVARRGVPQLTPADLDELFRVCEVD